MLEVEDVAVRLARLEERVSDLDEYRQRQNGAIERLASKYESLDAKFDAYKDGQTKLLVGLLVTAVTSLALQLITKWGG